ncbi:MAG TPA: hypothetical protein VG757_01835 [Devosia sp.]|nr:hypothetical protein [Devosia sp.]
MDIRRFDIIPLDGSGWQLTDSGSMGKRFTSSHAAQRRALELASETAGRVMIFLWDRGREEKIYDTIDGRNS